MASIQDQVSLRSGIASWLNRSDLTDSELDQFIETPMHLLFEGIVKSLIEIQMDFSKTKKMESIWRVCQHATG